MSVTLNGSSQPVALGDGYALRTPGMRGSAELLRPRSAPARARNRVDADGSPALEQAFERGGLTEVRRIDLALQPPATGPGALRSSDGRQDLFELIVPDLGPDSGQIVLASDEAGVLTWHLPVDAQQAVQPPATRSSGGVRRFLIPAHRPLPGSDEPAAPRSLIGLIGRKLLKVLVYPVLDPVVGALGAGFAQRWEARHRPGGLRDFAPANFRAGAAPALADGDWTRLAQGPALLFVHGTFSTAHAAFALLPDAVMADLHARYGGRVFAFDHPSLSADPRANAAWLRAQLPARTGLEVDIVCHSRGGLVARALAAGDDDTLRVRRIVFAGAPNAGTLLAHPDHMVRMLDRLTTALNLFPAGPVVETLEAIITVVKVIGHGTLKGLDGLASMQPGGAFLGALGRGERAGAHWYAISADYEPATGSGLKGLVTGGAADAVLDRVFEGAANDLVVPEAGVYEVDGGAAFPIAPDRRLRIGPEHAVLHTTLFAHPPVGARLLDWLPG